MIEQYKRIGGQGIVGVRGLSPTYVLRAGLRRSIPTYLSAILGSLFFATIAVAGSSATNAKVISIEANKGYGSGGLIFIKLDNSPTGKPSCSNHYWDYTLALTTSFDDKLYAILLTAFAGDALIETTGFGACNDNASMESLRSVQLKK